MPHFDIIKHSDITKSYRVARVMADYDIKSEHSDEHFCGDILIPDEWNIGVIVGASGTGKTTIARQVFGDQIISGFDWSAASVVDDFSPDIKMDEIEKAFYSVGFGSVPSWLKPFDVLSNGEKMRVELARAMTEREFVVFDEFTSVVDRQVACTASLAVSKAFRRTNKKFVAITCHYDVLEWLQPDWVFDTSEMRGFFITAHDRKNSLKSGNVGDKNGKNLGVIII